MYVNKKYERKECGYYNSNFAYDVRIGFLITKAAFCIT